MRSLAKLDLSGCTWVLGHQLDIVLPVLENLVYLDVSECNISKNCIGDLVQRNSGKRFQYINIRYCFLVEISEVPRFNLVDLLEFCPDLNMETSSQWITVLQQYSNLNMCAAAMEILDELRED